MYMVSSLPNSAEQWIRRFPFGPIEREAKGGPAESESSVTLQKSVGNQPRQSINRPGAMAVWVPNRIGVDGAKIGRVRPVISQARRQIGRRTKSAATGLKSVGFDR
jgi:hypothetical protein